MIRVLQRFFPRATQQEVETVIVELQDKVQDLMLDPYANYMFQTLAQSCSSEQRYYLLKKVCTIDFDQRTNKLIDFSFNDQNCL